MTINADTVWEIRTTGNQNNGGGFYNRVPGTSIDYSQQDAAQLSLTDIVTDAAGTGLFSAVGGFTAAMQGNIIFLTGGGVTLGWYEIVSYIDTNNVTIDRSAGANKTGVTGSVGGAFKIGGSLDSDFFGSTQKAAGNKIWIKSGTYTLGETISPTATGTTALPIIMEGYNTTRGDAPEGSNRPLVSCGSSYYMNVAANYWHWKHLRFTGSALNVFVCYFALCYNCYFENTSATANQTACYVSNNNAIFIKCEAKCTNGYTIYGEATCINCYIHDSRSGPFYATVIDSIIDTITVAGITLTASSVQKTIRGNVIYNCATGISGGTSYLVNVVNNIIKGCTTGASWSSLAKYPFVDYNCWNNVTDVVNISKGPHCITADPLLKDPANGDFTLDTGSPCFDAGMQLDAMVGL